MVISFALSWFMPSHNESKKTQTLHALIPDSEGTLRRYAATMSSMTEKAIITKRNSR